MNRYLSFATLMLFHTGLAMALPVITSVSGTIADDQTITINGTGLGTNNLRVEWLGGSSGVIESGAAGTAFENLHRAGWSEDLNPTIFDSSRIYSGNRSFIFDSAANGNDGRFGMMYDTGNNFSELYTSYVTYFDNRGVTSEGQWKMMRWCYTNSLVDSSTPNTLLSNWTGGPGDMYTFFNSTGTSSDNDRSIFMNNALPPSNGWYRFEAFMRPSSQAGASDGEVWVRTTRISDGAQVGYARHTGVKTYTSGESKRYRYVIFQNYQGNGFGSTGTKVWMDDIYIAQTQARVELCNAATWVACTKKDIQPPLTWADNRVTVKLNRGGLSSLTGTYLYVVDGSGAVNAAGYPLSGIAATVVPAPPTDVHVD